METELLRIWSHEDYDMLAAWWQGHGWPAVPERILPPLGVIFADKAAGFAYMDNGGSGVAMIEWLVTNPQAGLSAAKGLHHVVDFLSMDLARMGYTTILTTCRQESLARLLNREGFKTSDREMIHLVKTL
jgi:hypothetical protein